VVRVSSRRSSATGILAVLALFLDVGIGTASVGQNRPGFTRADGVNLSTRQIDSTVERLMSAAKVTGLALALIEKGEVSYVKAYGMADVSEGRPLWPDTVMYGASLTKAAFAYMVMTLADDGALNLDTPISDILPKPLYEYENYVDLANDDRWRQWTLRMLLSHQAGLPNWRWFSDSGKLTIIFEPGSRYADSGEGFQIAQLVLERGLGADVNQLMEERVFDRFDMHRTSMTWREAFRPNFANGYDEQGNDLGHEMRQSVQAAGSMDTTVTDFSAFLAGVVAGEGISNEAKAEMLGVQVRITARRQFPTQFPVDTDSNQDIQLSYGLGWGLFESRFGPAFFKEGHDDGTNNYALCLDRTRHCILILSNSSNAESIFLYLVNELLGNTGLPWEWEGYIPYDHPSGATGR
jgi:CubicO group peptidase (beta-lactamase class C family)